MWLWVLMCLGRSSANNIQDVNIAMAALEVSKFGIRAETEKGFGNLQVAFHASTSGTFKCRIWELSIKIIVMKKLPQFHCSFRTWISDKGDKSVLPHLYTYKEALGTVLSKAGLTDDLVLKKKKKNSAEFWKLMKLVIRERWLMVNHIPEREAMRVLLERFLGQVMSHPSVSALSSVMTGWEDLSALPACLICKIVWKPLEMV